LWSRVLRLTLPVRAISLILSLQVLRFKVKVESGNCMQGLLDNIGKDSYEELFDPYVKSLGIFCLTM
jgi:hypothetical protein